MPDIVLILVGLIAGAALAIVVMILSRRREQARQALREKDEAEARAQAQAAQLEFMRTSFAALSRDALAANSDDFLKLARTRLEQQTREAGAELEGKKKLIDAGVDGVNKKLGALHELLHQFDKQQREAHGSLTGHMERATNATNQLQKTAATLREALANPKRRGQWGERMAEDVLRLAGFVENVNYKRQAQLPNRRIPDFTFPLPSDRVIHMDVKFPLDNYLKRSDTKDPAQQQKFTQQFLRDVRTNIKQVTDRDYINPEAGTLDFVIVFIPNEQVYGFIHEQDPSILDDAMRMKVVLCGPLSLYAILSVIRQSAENFRLEKASRDILAILGSFRKQWLAYSTTMSKMGDRLAAATEQYEDLVGTRTRMLDRQLQKIEALESAVEPRSIDKSTVLPDSPPTDAPPKSHGKKTQTDP